MCCRHMARPGIMGGRNGVNPNSLLAHLLLLISFLTLFQCCVVGCRVLLFLSLWLHWDWDESHCVCPYRSSLLLCLRADWPRSPLAHGCRSTHNSPVHSACSSQRLSQNFSVSVPTLIFTGMKAGKEVNVCLDNLKQLV